MFNNKEKKDISKEMETIIGPQVRLKGNFNGQGNVIIEGFVEGDIKTNNFIFIGNKAIINANIEAKNAKISGEVNGNIKVDDYLEITQSAKISGDIMANQLSIEKGAIINGNCLMKKLQNSNK